MNVYLYYGEEDLLLTQAVSALRDKLIPPEMAALSHKKLNSPAIYEALEAVTSVSFNLGGSTLIEIQEFGALNRKTEDKTDVAQLEELKEALQNLEPTKHVLFVSKKIDRKIKFPKWLSACKGVDVKAFTPFKFWESDKATEQLIRIAQEREIALSKPAASLLVENMGVELLPLLNEVEKLAIYANGRSITPDDVRLLSNHCDNTFQMLSEWVKNNSKAAIYKTLDELLLRQHVNPLYSLTQTYLNTIFRLKYYRQLGYSEQDIADKLKKHPFKVKKDLEEFQGVTFERLVMLKQKTLELEWKYKTGQIESRLSYELLMGA